MLRRAPLLCFAVCLCGAIFFGSSVLPSVALASTASVIYTYDEAGRLKATTYSDGAATSYTLDAAGNRKQVQSTPPPPLPNPPTVPVITNLTASTATATWSWSQGTGGPASSYSYSINSGSYTTTGATLSANLTGLTVGANNTIQVIAVNLGGPSSPSSKTFLTLPSAPGTPTFTNITATTATVNWGSATGTVTSYSYSLNGAAFINVGTSQTVTLTGLSSGSSYAVQVYATNASGNGVVSSAALIPPPPPPGVPAYTNITATSATATWSAAASATAYSYTIDGGTTWTNVGASLSANLVGLSGANIYYFQVRGSNAGGSGTANFAYFDTLPAAPGSVTISNILATSATASWSAVPGVVTSYAYSTNGGSTWTNVGKVVTVSVTGLTPGANYNVQIHAIDVTGYGAAAASASFPTIPPAPGVPSFTNITATSATVNWAAASGIVSSYSYSINGSANTTVGSSVLTANLSSLTPGTVYTVRVFATNSSGNGAASSNQFTTSLPVPGTPGVPTFTNITSTSATMNWTAASGTVTSYSYSINGGTTWTNVGAVLTIGLTSLSATTTYNVQVRATNATGNGPPSSTTLTPAPTTPTNLVASTPAPTVIVLNWTGSTGGVGTLYYDVERCQGVGCSNFALVASLTNPNYSNTSLPSKTWYSYRIHTADSRSIYSSYSSVVSKETE